MVATTGDVYESVPTTHFPAGGGAGEGESLRGFELKNRGVAFVMGKCTSVVAQSHNLLLSLQHPPSIFVVPWPLPTQLVTPPGSHFPPLPLDGDSEAQVECEMWDLGKAKDWLDQSGKLHGSPFELTTERIPAPMAMTASRLQGMPVTYTILTDEGRVYAMYAVSQVELFQQAQPPSSRTPLPDTRFVGQAIYPPPSTDSLSGGMVSLGLITVPPVSVKAVEVAVNLRLGMAAVGLEDGLVHVMILPPWPQAARFSHALDLKHAANLRVKPGAVKTMAWTSDGYALAVGYENGWAVWSMGGRLDGWGVAAQEDDSGPVDDFMRGVSALFWAPGNLDLFMVAPSAPTRLFALPFVKSATTSQHSPDNTRYAFLQLDDRVLVYRGADQPDMSVINPESDVWQHIHIPAVYIATNWPIRYACISSDGRFVAVAGKRGLTHYSAASGRWKLFTHEREERAFSVRGGLLWFHHVLIAAVEQGGKYAIRLYSRDAELTESGVLSAHAVPAPVLCMSLLGNSLLVYTADSMLYHFLILPTRDTIRLQLCGSIGFQGLVTVPARVRALSWLVPDAQRRLGDPADDLIVATIIFLVDGRLVLLRPRRAGGDEVRYDMQVLADRIESYWTHLEGVGTLENSLWGYDGRSMRVWLDALTIEATRMDTDRDSYESVSESVCLRLDFYPLSLLIDKGIIIGVDHEPSARALPFALFKLQTSTMLFLPELLRYHLERRDLRSALAFASNYNELVYFAHALEVLLHSVLEDTVDALASKVDQKSDPGGAVSPGSTKSDGTGTLSLVATFLDHFPESLDVVVGCARKTEFEHWSLLFGVVGAPRELYERCIASGALRSAASYLLVMHTLEEADDAADTVRLLRLAIERDETQLCKELLRFLRSIDESGEALRRAVKEVGIAPPLAAVPKKNEPEGKTP